MPAPILLIILLTSFGLAGLAVQGAAATLVGGALPAWLAALPAAAAGVLSMRYLGRAFAFVLPNEETEAVSRESFIGRPALITFGEVSTGTPAQARLHDEFGQAHYMMVEPDDRFAQGEEVILVRAEGIRFHVIRNHELSRLSRE